MSPLNHWHTKASNNLSAMFNHSVLHYLTQDRYLDRLHPSPNLLAFLLVLIFAIVSLITNITSIVAFVSWSKLRVTQNLVLVNISIADIIYSLSSLFPALATYFFESSTNTTLCRMVFYVLIVSLYVAVYSSVLFCLLKCFTEIMRKHAAKQRHANGRVRIVEERKDFFFNGFKNNVAHQQESFFTPTASVFFCCILWLAFFVTNSNIFHSKDSTTASLLVLHQPLQCDHRCFMTLKQLEEEQRQKEREVASPAEIFKQHFKKNFNVNVPNQRGYSEPTNEQKQKEDNGLKNLWLLFLITAFLCPLALVSIFSGLLLFFIHCTRTPNRAPIAELTNSTRITTSLTASPVSYSPFSATNNMLSDYAAVISSRKDSVVLVMAISIVRFLCWLPLQVCLLIDVYGFSTHHNTKHSLFHNGMEMYGASCALFSCCINPLIYLAFFPDVRRSLVRCRRRWRRREKRKNLTLSAINAARMQSRGLSKPDLCTPACSLDNPFRYSSNNHLPMPPPLKPTHETNDTILSILCDSSNKINYN